MAEARLAPGTVDLSGYITTGILATHTAKTTTVHGIADTARLVTIDNIGTYAPAPDLTALVPRDGSRSMTGLLTAEAGVSIRDRYDPLTFGSGAASPATMLRSNGGLDIAVPGVGDTLYVTADNVNYVDHAANYALFQVSSTGAKFYNGSNYVPTIESGGTNAPYGVLVRSVHNGQPPLRVRGATGQTGTLQEWQTDTGTVLANISAGGQLVNFSSATINSGSTPNQVRIGNVAGLEFGASADAMLVRTGSGVLQASGQAGGGATSTTFVVKGLSGQGSTDLAQWQDSTGSPLLKVQAQGHLVSGAGVNIVSGAGLGVGAQGLYTPSYGSILNLNGGAATVGRNDAGVDTVRMIVKGKSPQTASLQEWQNSLGTPLAKVANDGTISSGAQISSSSYLSAYLGDAGQVSLGLMSIQGAARAGIAFGNPQDVFVGRTGAGVLGIGPAGAGIRLMSPDGLTTRTLSIDNTGTLVIN